MRSGDQGPQHLIMEGDEVKEFLDSRHRGQNLQYLFDWKGYDPEECSWVNANDNPGGDPGAVCLLTPGGVHGEWGDRGCSVTWTNSRLFLYHEL